MNYHIIDRVTLLKTIEILDQYHWNIHNNQTVEERAKAEIPLILNILRAILISPHTTYEKKDGN